MNVLIVGSKKEVILEHLPHTFLLIDDGELIDRLDLPPRRAVTHFDVREHAFNPLKDMDYLKARAFWDVLKAIYPEGAETLTKASAEFQILTALADRPKSLDTLIKDTKDTRYAYQMIQKLLLSPVLQNVLTRPTNLSFKGIILARLDRAELGDFDCFVLGNLLMQRYPGPIVVPDFGFYGTGSHSSLLRQNRLIAGIHSFDEVPALRQQLLLIEEKIASRCTPDDAKELALYTGFMPSSLEYVDFIERCIS